MRTTLKRTDRETGSTRHLIVMVESQSGRHTIEVPVDARVDELVPSLVEVFETGSDPEGWALSPMGEPALAGDRTIGECGLFPGAVLELVAPARPEHPGAGVDAFSAAELARRLQARFQRPARPPDTSRLGAAAYQRMLDDAIAAPRLSASSVVAVMSDHAGAGTTTIAILLATLLTSLRSDQVAVIDACPQSGALSHWMAPESGASGERYRSLLTAVATPDQVRAALVRITPKLAILPAPIDQLGKPAAGEEDWARLIQHLRHLHNIVILDCGAGFQRPECRAALAAADQVVLVGRSAPGDLDRLSAAIEPIRHPGQAVVVVASQATRRTRAKQWASGAQLVSLAYEPQAAGRLKTRGFSWSEAPQSWQESVRELAAILIASGQTPS
jgi:MinD-like ATPase involved in chromosome partitioning or flagellar assembly